MTEALKERLARGRREAAERKRAQLKQAMADYGTWLKRESAAYEALLSAREMYGSSSTEAMAAHTEWHASLAAMPAISSLPSDQTWRELRDEND